MTEQVLLPPVEPAGAAGRPAPGGPLGPARRSDIQGLRAVAVGAVIAFHAAVPRFAGGYVGVDVFFVISGFLITGQLLRIVDSPTIRRSLIDFYARRIRRLLPVAFMVIVVTAVLVRIMTPPLEWSQSAATGRASALYYVNFFLARNNTAYLSDTTPSPFQQYWSLAVEEQFYVIWPAALLLLAFVWKRRRGPIASTLFLGALISLALCAYVTSKEQPLAFFLLPTRAWEFALGALLVLGSRQVDRVPSAVRDVLAWLGLLAVVAAILFYGSRTLFPGVTALLPTLGTAAILAADGSATGRGPGRLLSLAPLVWIGEISYSLYLWHWPLLVVPSIDRNPLSPLVRVLLVALTVVLAAASYRFVENPLRRSARLGSRTWRSFGFGVVVTIVGVLIVTSSLSLPKLYVDQALPTWPGDTSPTRAPVPTVVGRNLTPSLTAVAADQPDMPQACIADFLTVVATTCTGGDPTSSKIMVLLGDSHAQEWYPALNTVAAQDGFKLVTLLKVSCPPMSVRTYNARLGREYSQCDQWRVNAMHALDALRPSVVVVGHLYDESLIDPPADPDTYWGAAMAKLLASLPADAQKIVIGDNPIWQNSPPTCLSAHLSDVAACSEPESTTVDSGQRVQEFDAARRYHATTIDTAALLCPGGTCPAVLWNVDAYRDHTHVSATLASHLAPEFQAAVEGDDVG